METRTRSSILERTGFRCRCSGGRAKKLSSGKAIRQVNSDICYVPFGDVNSYLNRFHNPNLDPIDFDTTSPKLVFDPHNHRSKEPLDFLTKVRH